MLIMIFKIITLILAYIIQAKIWYKLGELKSKEKQSKMLDEIITRDCMIKGLEEHIKNS
jgi:hypothetical protein